MKLFVLILLIGVLFIPCIVANEPNVIVESNPQTLTKNWWEMDDRDWFDNTPEGQDLSRRLISGELSVDDAKFIFDEMGEGKTYEEARTSIGHGLSRLRRWADQPKRSYESFLEEDWRPVTKEWWKMQEKRAGRTGWVGAGVIGMGDILVSSVRAVGEGVSEIIAGRESGAQAFGALIMLLMVWIICRRLAQIPEWMERRAIAMTHRYPRLKDGK